jgi:hypothetical protein
VHDHHVLAIWFDEQAKNDAKRGNVELATAASAEADWARDATRQLHDEFLKASPIAIVARGLLAVGHTLSAQAL